MVNASKDAQKNTKVARRGQPHSGPKIILIGLKTGAKTGPKTGSQNWTQNCNQFRKLFLAFFGHATNLCPLWARVLQLSHFLRASLLLRRLTTSSYLGESLNGSHILRAFQILKFGPSFSCNMLRARRRHAIDGDPGAKSRRSKDENGAKSERQGTEARKTEFTQTLQHQICTYMSRHEAYGFHCHFRSMT